MEGLSRWLASLRVSRLIGALLIALSVVAGYLFAGWLLGPRDATPLAQICARVDYLNSLQQELREPLSEEMRNEIRMLVGQCSGAILRDRAEKSD
jgi:hypothetical protein